MSTERRLRQLASTAPAHAAVRHLRAAFVELRVTDLAASEHFYASCSG